MSSMPLIAVGRVTVSLVESLESRLVMSASAFPVGPQPWITAEVAGLTEYDRTLLRLPTGSLSASEPTTLFTNPAKSALGGNLNMQSDRIQDHPFTDLVKTTRGFYNLAGRTASNGKMALANTGTNGWATEDFALSLADNAEYKVPIEAGVYRMAFNGPVGTTVAVRRNAPAGAATVPTTAPLPTLTKLGYDAATGRHTYDINVPAGVLTLALDFRNTGGQVRDLKVLQPGYDLASHPTFSNAYVSLLRNLSPNVLRLMDFTQTNNNPVSSWDARTKPTDATQTKVGVAGDLVPAKGIAWEYAIELANAVGTNVWVNVPAQASDDYVNKLATLLRTTLNSNADIYLEYSNEVWNTQFSQTKYNTDQARAEVNSNPSSNLDYDGSTNSTTWADRRYARRLKQVADIFRNNWTGAGQVNPLNTRVRAVLAGQYANQARFDNELAFLNRFYGDPKSYIYGIGIAPYINLGSQRNVEGLTEDQVLSALQSNVNSLRSGTGLSNARNRATKWGVNLVAYEGGIDTFGPTSIAAKRSAMLDPRIKDIVTGYLDVWYDKGGNQFNWYTLGARSFNSPNGTWSITEDIRNPDQPKAVGFKEVRDLGRGNAGPTPEPPPPVGTVVRPAADAYVRDGTSAGTNFGSATDLVVKRSANAGNTREAYLRFSLSSVATINSAKLRLFGRLSATSNGTVTTTVYNASNTTWTESGLTWNNRPLPGTTSRGTIAVSGTTAKWYELDLTSFLKAEKAAGRNLVTLVLRNLTSTDAQTIFNSDENAGNKPQLVLG